MCKFSLPFAGNAESLVRKARQEIERAGGTFDGGATQGNFQVKTPIGSVTGSYVIAEQQMSLAIHKKPIFLSCEMIQNELSKVILK